MNPFLYRPDFIDDPQTLFHLLSETVEWDERMKARKTASFGVPYNYSQITYAAAAFPKYLDELRQKVAKALGFTSNNCLLNYYPDGQSSMGFHSDTATGRQDGTGVAIISLGAPRTMALKRKDDPEIKSNNSLGPGSLIYLDDETQKDWLHAIPKMPEAGSRIRLSFRAITTL